MLKQIRIVLLALFLLFSLSAYATSESQPTTKTIKIDSTYVTITNNLDKPIHVRAVMRTTDMSFLRGKAWDFHELNLEPYESKEVLWFSRSHFLKNKQLYQFDLKVEHADFPTEVLTFNFAVTTKAIVGSNISTQWHSVPARPQLFSGRGLEKFSTELWGAPTHIYVRNWLPKAHLYSNYHLVIDQPQKNTFSSEKKTQISVLTYNTQLLPFYACVIDDINQSDIRAKDIPAFIKNYDVVILQELLDRHLRDLVITGMQVSYPYHSLVVGHNTSKVLTGGVMIFSKWPIIKEDQIVYSLGASFDNLAAKGVSYIAINKQGKTYHIVGTHLQSGEKITEKHIRQKQLEEMHAFIQQLHVPVTEPLLIGGDLNVNRSSNESETLLNSLHVKLIDNMGYRYSADSQVNTMAVYKGSSYIDYIFFSNHHEQPFKAINKVFVIRDFDNEKKWPKFDLSDHFPVAGYFEFKE